jgi:hypothetical protein
MKAIFRIMFALVVLSTALSCSAAADYQEASELGRAGNAWKPGDPIPAKLLEYRTSRDDSCFPSPRGTEMLFQAITNYLLLREIAFLPKIDARVFSNAVINAVTLVGPTRFFTDLTVMLKEKPALEKQDRFKMLAKQSKVKHVVVDSLYITFADMAPDSARKVLNEIKDELQSGKPWHDVYWKFMETYECPYEEKFSDGTVIKGKRSKIGNLGDFVLPANGNPLFSYREDWMPKGHVKTLFGANVRDILILFDKEDLTRFQGLSAKETGERYVLYQVREIYGGDLPPTTNNPLPNAKPKL